MDAWTQVPSAARPAFQPPPDWTRRQLGALVIVIALLWPFYAHLVERILVRVEMALVQEQLAADLEAAAQQARASGAAAAARQQAERDAAAAMAKQARINSARVIGVMDGQVPVLIVERLPPEGAAESGVTLCAQASRWLRRDLRGVTVRVQRDQGSLPASEAGWLHCD